MSPDTNTDPQSIVDEDPHTASDSLVFGKWPGPSDILENFDDEVDDEPVNPSDQWRGLFAAESDSRGDGSVLDQNQALDQTQWRADTGATTAEYAITTLAACGFAALMVIILKSEPIKELITGVIQTALGLGS